MTRGARPTLLGSSFSVLLFLLTFSASADAAAGGPRISGRVLGARGEPVANARVTVTTPAGARNASTDEQGRFEVARDGPAEATVAVEAAGFLPAERRLAPSIEQDVDLTIVLSRAVFADSVTVTATRTERALAQTAASAVVLDAPALVSSAAHVLDEVLREVPGFALFRRSDSRTANPTSQGVSLRGVGASGASRAAVLDDGVPVNDPFGGWVYWGRFPLASLARVELVRGGASDLYGGSALSGAVQLIRRDAAPALDLDSSWGSRETGEASLFASGRTRGWDAGVSAETFRTTGYVPVSERERGPVDREASSRHESLELTLGRELASGSRLFVRGSSFDETRQNGTALQRNDTRIRQLVGGADWDAAGGAFRWRAYTNDETFHQTFSAIAPDRSTETLTRAQRVPARAYGLTGQWTRAFGSHLVVAGVDGRDVRGSSDEDVFSAAAVTFASGGGRQQTGGLFVEDLWSASARLTVSAGARFDGWRNIDGELSSGPSRQTAAVHPLADRSESAVSPRLSLLYAITPSATEPSVSLTASAYRSFRAPTLNELYRSFRLGNVLTLANEELDAERLSGGEAGAIVTAAGGRVGGRATLYWMQVTDTIASVTVSTTPQLVTRRRENLGETRSRGVELEAEARPAPRLDLVAGYLFADSRVIDSPATPALQGLRVPQVPRHQGTLRIRYEFPSGITAALYAQLVGRAFEDDQNALPLAGYAKLDAFFSFPVTRAIEAIAAAENLLDRRYPIARTPVTNVGLGRAVRAGVRVKIGKR